MATEENLSAGVKPRTIGPTEYKRLLALADSHTSESKTYEGRGEQFSAAFFKGRAQGVLDAIPPQPVCDECQHFHYRWQAHFRGE